jgi:hypothetical protein
MWSLSLVSPEGHKLSSHTWSGYGSCLVQVSPGLQLGSQCLHCPWARHLLWCLRSLETEEEACIHWRWNCYLSPSAGWSIGLNSRDISPRSIHQVPYWGRREQCPYRSSIDWTSSCESKTQPDRSSIQRTLGTGRRKSLKAQERTHNTRKEGRHWLVSVRE